MDLGLTGKSAVITGGSGGIGSMIAVVLAEEGANIGLLVRDMDRAGKVLERIKGIRPGVICSAFQADLLSSPEVIKAVKHLADALDGVDILINCAGDSARGGIEELEENAWIDALSVKPLGCLRVCKAALSFLKKSAEGRIVNIAGGHGKEPTAYSMIGGIANAGTLSFTKSLSEQLAPHGITVNAVSPGHTDTGRWTALIERTAREKGLDQTAAENLLLQRVPLRRVVSTRDVAAAVAFLCSGQASMITGCVLNVDGGRARGI
jgi:NAD(P)-dependent dehydrogenase (short-subunit alcohol dehydrogenase family)